MSVRSLITVIVVLPCFFLSSPAQKLKPSDLGIKSKKALNLYLEGMQYSQYRQRVQASEAFAAAIEIEPEFAHAHFRLATNIYALGNYEEALPHLEKAYELRPGDFREIEFYLGEAYFNLEKYGDAAKLYESFLRRRNGRQQNVRKATLYLQHARFAAQAIKNPVDFEPMNLGEEVNSTYADYIPCLNADGSYLLFVSRRPGVGEYNASFGGYSEDFFYSENNQGKWSKAENLGEPINTHLNEGASTITQDGKYIFYTACNQPDGYGDCDIYMATLQEDGTWSNGQNLGPKVNTRFKETQPSVSHDGKTLYFSSGRITGEGLGDIWVCEIDEEGKWTEAKNMGEVINTPGHEEGPFIHADGKTLYFSSNFHPGFGKADLFFTNKQSDGTWSKPQNLGYPINTPGVESHIFITSQGDRAFYTAEREDTYGKSDIYEFILDERIRPQRATFLRGIVKDSLTEAPVYANIELKDVETGETVRNVYSGKNNGSFLMSLPLEREYAAFVEAKGYLFKSQNFYLKNLAEETYFDLIIEMIPLEKNKKVVLQNIFFESGKYDLKSSSEAELSSLARFLKTNDRMRIEIQGHTDDVGSDRDNLILSQKRAEAVRSYLVGRGIHAERIVAKGYGESDPKAPNNTAENRALNRRTEFKILDTGE
jgi:outer membrane protein OmpA-like peptidoglycan-associated protein/tetratricopeptide (TPR) repeat protein